jgi:chromosome partitioning protein
MREQHQDHIWQSAIPVDTRLRDASREGLGINQLAPDSRGARAYQSLLKSLLALG